MFKTINCSNVLVNNINYNDYNDYNDELNVQNINNQYSLLYYFVLSFLSKCGLNTNYSLKF